MEVDRTTPQKRVEDFVKRAEGLIHEMRHNERLSHIAPLHLLATNHENLRLAMFMLSIWMNVLILFFTVPSDDVELADELYGDADWARRGGRAAVGSAEWERGYWDVRFRPVWLGIVVMCCGFVLFLLAFASLLAHCISTLPLTLRSAWEERGITFDVASLWPLTMRIELLDAQAERKGQTDGGKSKKGTDDDAAAAAAAAAAADDKKPLEDPFADADALERRALRRRVLLRTPLLALQNDSWLLGYYLPYLTLCALGLLASPFCFVVTLFDMVVRSRLLQKVIQSVTVNSDSLAQTFTFVAVVVYHFALIGQLFFREDYKWEAKDEHGNHTTVDLCRDTRECLLMTLYIGLSYDGLAQGLSDIRDEWTSNPETAYIRWAVDLMFYILVIVSGPDGPVMAHQWPP